MSLVSVVNDDVHAETAVTGIDVGLRCTATVAALTTRLFAVKHAAERDAKLLAEPAIHDKVDSRLESKQQHGKQLEQQQGAGRLAKATNTHDGCIHHVWSLSIQHIKYPNARSIM